MLGTLRHLVDEPVRRDAGFQEIGEFPIQHDDNDLLTLVGGDMRAVTQFVPARARNVFDPLAVD